MNAAPTDIEITRITLTAKAKQPIWRVFADMTGIVNIVTIQLTVVSHCVSEAMYETFSRYSFLPKINQKYS